MPQAFGVNKNGLMVYSQPVSNYRALIMTSNTKSITHDIINRKVNEVD